MTKRAEEIVLMVEAGVLLADVFGYLDRLNQMGMSAMEVNKLVEAYLVNVLKARPASKGQYGYAYALTRGATTSCATACRYQAKS
jgi:methionyl aminopeptidase